MTKSNIILSGVAAAALGFLSTSAFAADLDEPIVENSYDYYVSVFGGIIFEDEFDSTISNGPAAGQTVDADLETGFRFGGAIGASLGDFAGLNTRVELEVSYQRSDVDDLLFSGNGPGAELNVGGDVSTLLVLANAFVDFDTGTAFTPYLGVGAGVGFVDFDFQYQTGPLIVVDDDDTGFAGQVIAGVSYDFTDNVALTLDARYSRVFDVEADRVNVTAGGVNTGTIDDDIDNFGINLGLRFKF